MSNIHTLSGAYAVDALDDMERARFEQHLDECDVCEDEVDGLREAASLLAETAALAPSARLRADVLSRIETVRPLPPVVANLTRHRATRRRGRLAGLVAAAAIVVAGAGVGGAVWHPWQQQAAVQLSATQQVLQAPDARTAGSRTAPMTISKSLNAAVVDVSNLGDPGRGKVYELWLQHGSTMVPAGLIPKGSDRFVLLAGDVNNAQGAAISAEPTGGSRTNTPTGETTAIYDFSKA